MLGTHVADVRDILPDTRSHAIFGQVLQFEESGLSDRGRVLDEASEDDSSWMQKVSAASRRS